MSDCMLCQQNLFFVLPQLFSNLVQIDNTVVDRLFVRVVLGNPQTFRNALETLVELTKLKSSIPHTQNAVIYLITSSNSLELFLEKISQGLVKISVHFVDTRNWNFLLCIKEAFQIASFESVVALLKLTDSLGNLLWVDSFIVF